MKNIQSKRLIMQIISIILTVFGFFANFQITMGIIMLLTILAGAFYCGWICPFGTFQDLFSKIGRLLKIKKKKMPTFIQKYLKYSRYVIAIIFTIFSIDFLFDLFAFDPRVNFLSFLQGTYISISALIVILTFGFIAIFFERPFCNYLCFEGAKYGALSSVRIFTVKRNKEKCIKCSKCNDSCPMNIKVTETENVTSLQCINCFECISVCPIENALTFEKVRLTDKIKKRYKKVLLGIVIVVVILLLVTLVTGSFPLKKDTNTDIDSVNEIAYIDINDDEISEILLGNEYIDGTYRGTGRGFRGNMTVEVIVEKSQIVSVVVIDTNDDARWFNRANDTIPDEIVQNQTYDVDIISGATYSSIGIIEATKAALLEAKAN